MDSTTPPPSTPSSTPVIKGNPRDRGRGASPARESLRRVWARIGIPRPARSHHVPGALFLDARRSGDEGRISFPSTASPAPGRGSGAGEYRGGRGQQSGERGLGGGGIGEKEEVPKGSNSKSHAWTHSTSPPFFVARQSSQILAVLGGGLSPPREGLRKIRWHRGPAAPAKPPPKPQPEQRL